MVSSSTNFYCDWDDSSQNTKMLKFRPGGGAKLQLESFET